MVRAGVSSEPWHTTNAEANAEAEIIARIGEPVEKVLELFFTVCDEGSIISEEKVAQHYFANFGLCWKACRVEEFPVRSSA